MPPEKPSGAIQVTVGDMKWKVLHKVTVGPNLEQCIQAWTALIERNVTCLESVQQLGNRMVDRWRNKSYSGEVKDLNLCTMEGRSFRGGLIELLKLLSGFRGKTLTAY